MITLDKVAFYLFGRPIAWYGIIIACGILLCFCLAIILCKVKKIDAGMPTEIFLAIIPLGIVCARLFSVIFEPNSSIADFFNFKDGGMSIIGAIIGGAIGATVYKFIKKQPFLVIADIITSVLFLGQSIGRWGNYINGEVYGQVVTNPDFMKFPFAVEINGTWHEALFFYEAVLTFIGFVGLLVLYLKTKKPGLCTGTYLLYYGIVRTILESRREEKYILRWGNVPISQVLSAIFIVIGLVVLIWKIVEIVKEKKENSSGNKEVHQ